MVWYKKRKEEEVQNGLMYKMIWYKKRKEEEVLWSDIWKEKRRKSKWSDIRKEKRRKYFSFLWSDIRSFCTYKMIWYKKREEEEVQEWSDIKMIFSKKRKDQEVHFVLPSLFFSFIRSFCTSFSFLFLYQIILYFLIFIRKEISDHFVRPLIFSFLIKDQEVQNSLF